VLPVYLATRPLAAGETRVGGTGWNIARTFAATYAVGVGVLLLRYFRLGAFAIAWAGMSGGGSLLRTLVESLGVLAACIVLPAGVALGIGVLLRKPTTEVGPTGPLAARADGIF
jgi:hypothetical protein